MLKNLKDLQGYALRATDGDIGKVVDFYFDDEQWTVRYLVVETGGWLASRKVLVAPASLGTPDHADRVVPVSITREQVRDSPDIDTDKPVSRQHELDYLDYYGYPAYWDSSGLWGAGGLPGMALPDAAVGAPLPEEAERIARANAQVHRDDDPHLRSVKAVTGYHLKASDGEIGHVQGFLVDEQDWTIRYLSVETSHWWSGHKVLLAPSWIKDVSWIDRQVAVSLTRQEIRAAPAWDAAMPPDRTQEIDMYKHYDRAGYW